MQIYSPAEVGMCAERLGRISTTMKRFVKDDQMPGILTLVQRKGKIVQFGAYGKMDIEGRKPMQEDAIFRIYSMTKPIISVALMMLLEEGVFNLHDPVSNFIPAFGQTKVYAGAESLGPKLVDQAPAMTLHHLLTHTSGLSYGWLFDSPVEDNYRQELPYLFHRSQTLEESVEKIAAFPLLFQPGTQWRYSYAYDVLGYIIQRVADMPLADFLQERIFAPLGMNDTTFQVPAAQQNRLAQIYGSQSLNDPTSLEADLWVIGDITTPTNGPLGGSGLASTMHDYLAFCNCLLNEGQYENGRLLSRKTVEWMTNNHIPAPLRPLKLGPWLMGHGFGLGFRVITSRSEAKTLTSLGEYGWQGAANTWFWIDPAEELIGIFMTQYLPTEPYPTHQRFQTLTYQALVD